MISLDEINFAEMCEYLKNYYRDPTYWSTPRGLANLLLFAQAITGAIYMHNVIYHLWDYPHFWSILLSGFVFVKFPIFAAIVCNKTRTPLRIGQSIGAGCVLSVYALTESLYWGRTAKCENLNIESIHLRQYCTTTVVKTMSSQSVSLAFLSLFFFSFTALLIMNKEAITDETTSYTSVTQSASQQSVGAFNSLDIDEQPLIFEKKNFSPAQTKSSPANV